MVDGTLRTSDLQSKAILYSTSYQRLKEARSVQIYGWLGYGYAQKGGRAS